MNTITEQPDQAKPKVTITIRALVQRINRKLRQGGQKLCTARGAPTQERRGQYYVVETGRQVRLSGVVHEHVNLEKFGHKLGVIRSWEGCGKLMDAAEKSLARIAHHEAGHVVMAARQWFPFDAVSIEPDGDSLGRAWVNVTCYVSVLA